MHSLSRSNKGFYYLLMAIMVIHASLMVIKFRAEITKTVWTPQKTIKLKLIQEAMKSATQTRQIVQSEDSASQDKPKDKAFLSDKDRAFDRESVAKSIDTFKKAALGNASL